jgi:hypothetical protein
MATLRVSFSGLCVFTFDHPLKGDGPKPRRASVLLPRLTRARTLGNQANGQPEVLDQHFPMLEFNLTDWNPESTRKADFHCLPGPDGRMTKGMCLLTGEDLRLCPDGEDRSGVSALDLTRDRPSDPLRPVTPKDQETLWWMATLADAFPDSPGLHPAILRTPPGSNQPVLARVQLDAGKLRTRDLTDVACTIFPARTDFHQRVATSFELDLAFRDRVEFRMTANRNGRTTTRRLVLSPPPGQDLEIGIMNMEIDKYIGMDPADGPRAEADFEVYAELLAAPLQGPRPFLRQMSPGNPAGIGVSSCVPLGGCG